MAATTSEDVKVVLIGTQYVEADPNSFKSVVQRLTGKDSCLAWIEESSFCAGGKTAEPYHVAAAPMINGNKRSSSTYTTSSNNIDDASSILSKGLSFKELDRMILEAPPLEELNYWLSSSSDQHY